MHVLTAWPHWSIGEWEAGLALAAWVIIGTLVTVEDCRRRRARRREAARRQPYRQGGSLAWVCRHGHTHSEYVDAHACHSTDTVLFDQVQGR